MLHTNVVLFLAIAIFAVSLSQLESSEAAAVLEKGGYTFIGKIQDTQSTARGLRAVESLYYVVDDPVTAAEASQNCKADIEGQLIAPTNSIQIKALLQFLNDAGRLNGQHFWTAGQNEDCKWSWRTTGKAISGLTLLPANFSPGHYISGNIEGRCLTLTGKLGSFGFCNNEHSDCTELHPYICVVTE